MEIQPSEERKLVHIYSTDGTIKGGTHPRFWKPMASAPWSARNLPGLPMALLWSRLGKPAFLFMKNRQRRRRNYWQHWNGVNLNCAMRIIIRLRLKKTWTKLLMRGGGRGQFFS